MILLSMTKHTKAGSTVCAVWAKDFEIHTVALQDLLQPLLQGFTLVMHYKVITSL